nr:unnamed protein product [Digitaria exilis]
MEIELSRPLRLLHSLPSLRPVRMLGFGWAGGWLIALISPAVRQPSPAERLAKNARIRLAPYPVCRRPVPPAPFPTATAAGPLASASHRASTSRSTVTAASVSAAAHHGTVATLSPYRVASPVPLLSRGAAGRRRTRWRTRRRVGPPPPSPHPSQGTVRHRRSLFLAALPFLFSARIEFPRWQHRQIRRALHRMAGNPTPGQNGAVFVQRQDVTRILVRWQQTPFGTPLSMGY